MTHFACSPDGRWLASSGGVWEHPARYKAGELRLWDLRTERPLVSACGALERRHLRGIQPDSRYLASGSGVWDTVNRRDAGGEFRLWDPASGAPRVAWRVTPAASFLWPSAPTAGSWPAAA